jgi:hypothetical protein
MDELDEYEMTPELRRSLAEIRESTTPEMWQAIRYMREAVERGAVYREGRWVEPQEE